MKLLYTLRSLYPGKRSDLRYLTRGRSKYSLKRVRPTPRAITTSHSLFVVGAVPALYRCWFFLAT
ncbi:hypothetical protein GIB67_032852, partial [Kingdonia uniflora]